MKMKWLSAHWSRLTGGLVLAAVAIATGKISYSHIYALSIVLFQTPTNARLFPVGIDGLILVGSVVLLQATPNHPYLGWFGVVPGVAASVFANFESGIAHGWLAAAWASVPAGGFALATFLLERWLKDQVNRVVQGGSGGSANPEIGEESTPVSTPPADHPEPAEPLTPEAALLALIGTSSRRGIAALLDVPKARVDRWAATLPALVQGGSPECAEDPGLVGAIFGNGSAQMNGDSAHEDN
jgi:hypothetical protein